MENCLTAKTRSRYRPALGNLTQYPGYSTPTLVSLVVSPLTPHSYKLRGAAFIYISNSSPTRRNSCIYCRNSLTVAEATAEFAEWIEGADAQGNATVFVAKFFGRAGLINFIAAVPENQRPSLFQSLLFEAAGRTVNPVNGAVGLMWTGNWHVCQAAVETVLRGGALKSIPELLVGITPNPDDGSDCTDVFRLQKNGEDTQLDLSLSPSSRGKKGGGSAPLIRRKGSPSMNSEESVTTTCGDHEAKLLNLFN